MVLIITRFVLDIFPDHQLETVNKIKSWLNQMSQVKLAHHRQHHFQQFNPSDVFIGYHEDAPASIFLRYFNDSADDDSDIVEKAKKIFLQCATPDAISRFVHCFRFSLKHVLTY